MSDKIGRFKNAHLRFTPPGLMRHVAVRRIAASDQDFPGVEFKIASSEAEMAAAFELLKESYVRRGIAREGQMRLQIISLLPTTTTFIAKSGDEVIGTISLIEDSDLGLPMEKVHPAEAVAIRKLFRSVAEVGALAVRPDYRRSGLSIMLYNMLYRWARQWRRVDDLLIAVHPSAQFFYKNILLFEVIGPPQRYEDLQGAASLPLRLDILGAQLRFYRVYRDRIVDTKCRRDFYSFFCGPTDRFNFSDHPHYAESQRSSGPLKDVDVLRLFNRFSLSAETIQEREARVLHRHFPDVSFMAEGTV